MDNEQSNFFEPYYNCCGGSTLQFLSNKSCNDPCKPGQKCFVGDLFDKWFKGSHKTKRSDYCDEKVSSTDTVVRDECNVEYEEDKSSYRDSVPDSCTKRPMPQCCIKEQNPLAPCCCEVRSEDDDDDGSPCPPSGYSQNPRAPTCGCDLCRKNGFHGRCCDPRSYVEAPPRLEKA